MRISRLRPQRFQTNSIFWIVLLGVFAALLVTVAILQFRSTAQMGRAAEEQLGGNVESLMIDWHLDFYRHFSAICVALQVGPDSGAYDNWADFRDRYAQWRRTAPFPQLVRDVYIWETSQRTEPRLLRLDPEEERLEAIEPGGKLIPLLGRLRSRSSNLYSGLRVWRPNGAEDSHASRYESLISDPLTGWQFDQRIPAIVHPIVHHKLPMRVDEPSSPEAIDWIVIALDMHTIQNQILPMLAQRHFGPPDSADYIMAVAEQGNPGRVLYDSSPAPENFKSRPFDAMMNIFGPPAASTEDSFSEAVKNANSVRVQNWRNFSGPLWFPLIRYSNTQGPWMLVLTHRNGPLEDKVAHVRRINLLMNSFVLLLLAASTTLVVIAGHRAHQYARLQMDFVASITHELRTPLTAIYSAGENLTDGVVETKSQLQHYGAIITSQARQLIHLVDQILTFSFTRSGDGRYEMGPLDISQVISTAVQNVHAVLKTREFAIEVDVPSDLPHVLGDARAVASCIQNLVANAVKYSDKSRWIRISARVSMVRGACEVGIDVEDRGIGIAASELTDIFKPFYRSSTAKTAQIHGTGLGLSLAMEIAEAMGGRLTVKSSLGEGSTFTLSLPCAS
jgi:signal transduction histidine kinase